MAKAHAFLDHHTGPGEPDGGGDTCDSSMCIWLGYCLCKYDLPRVERERQMVLLKAAAQRNPSEPVYSSGFNGLYAAPHTFSLGPLGTKLHGFETG